MARWAMGVWLLASAVIGATACKSEPAKPAGANTTQTVAANAQAAPETPRIVKEEGPMPAPDTVLARAGDHTVTLAEFEKSSRISLLFGPEGLTEMPAERLAIPHIHATMSQALLGQKLMMAEAKRRGLLPDEAEIAAWLQGHERLSRFGDVLDEPAKLEPLLAPYDLKREDLFDIARVELAKERLTNALVEEISDDEVWKAYAIERTTRTLALVSMSNVPTSKEIDAFLAGNAAKIDDYFHKNPSKFRIPRRARLHTVRFAPGKKVEASTLKKAAAQLERGVQPVTIAKELGLEHELDVQIVRGENPRAFGAKPGTVGWEEDGPRGAYAWKLQGFEASRLPEMSRPLRREIAATMLRTEALTPHVRKKLEEAAKILRTTPTDELGESLNGEKEVKFEIVTTTNHPAGVLPGFGLAESVVKAAFETEVGEVSEPIMSRERGFLFKVIARQDASSKEFTATLEANRTAYQDAFRPRALQMWVEQNLNEKGATVDTKALRVKYGVLQKK